MKRTANKGAVPILTQAGENGGARVGSTDGFCGRWARHVADPEHSSAWQDPLCVNCREEHGAACPEGSAAPVCSGSGM
jgi:hypothetical protein